MAQEHEKYLFDLNNFDGGSTFNPDSPPPPVFSEGQMEAARKEGHAEGYQKGLQDGQASRDQQVVELTKKISTGLGVLTGAEATREKRFETELIELTRMVFQQTFPILNDHYGLPQIEDTIRRTIAALADESSIQIEVSSTDQEDLSDRLRALLTQHAGHIAILSSPDIEPGSFRMKWKDGGAIRDTKTLAQAIIQVLGRTLAEAERQTND